jgi:5-methylcytosine-specific restriction endonuclease McrA
MVPITFHQENAVPELVFMSVREAFNRVGAVKKDGTQYQSVHGISVASTGRHFRFWDTDVLHHTPEQMELYRPPVEGHDWRLEPKGRAFYRSLVVAWNTSEPIFVIINRRDSRNLENSVNAKDAAPLLTQEGDPASGHVQFVNPETGELKVVMDLRRSSGTPLSQQGYADQFTVVESEVMRTEQSSTGYSRNPEIRRVVLLRSAGVCECCGTIGFLTAAGVYMETHHVVPLSELGRDSTDNVVALCPNCHKAAHFALDRADIKRDLIRLLDSLKKKPILIH